MDRYEWAKTAREMIHREWKTLSAFIADLKCTYGDISYGHLNNVLSGQCRSKKLEKKISEMLGLELPE